MRCILRKYSILLFLCLISTVMAENALRWTQSNVNEFKNRSLYLPFIFLFKPEQSQNEWTKSNQPSSLKHYIYIYIYILTGRARYFHDCIYIYLTCQVEITKSIISLEIYFLKTNVNVYELFGMHYVPVFFLHLTPYTVMRRLVI